MSHMPPFRLNVPHLIPDLPPAPTSKKRRKNSQAPVQPPNVQDLLPPPLSGYGDTIVASNPFDDCPSIVNVSSMARNLPMGMGGPGPNMIMGNNMGMYRPLCRMGMDSSLMHGPSAHEMMVNGSRMGQMVPGPGHGPPHMMPNPMGPNMNMIGGPLHNPIGNMGAITGPGPGSGGPIGSPMGHAGNDPSLGRPGGLNNMPMATSNGSIGVPMNNNNCIMSPMNSIYPKPMPATASKVYPVDQPMVFNSQNPNAPPIYPCGVCHKEVHDNDQAILLRKRLSCTGLTEAAFQLLTAEVYAEWVCDKCVQSKSIPLVKCKP
ncbi:hypothetical protein NQ315_002915 [Exocentrus adspersus]|uniref:Protein pygopus n=1 Tax=Exocentrus adspersus TaxID=1586481 RepID=A0AAV8V688_9CUCU|nr:hypothetical protein NQ315_002915 [Exocentrus adspersus]